MTLQSDETPALEAKELGCVLSSEQVCEQWEKVSLWVSGCQSSKGRITSHHSHSSVLPFIHGLREEEDGSSRYGLLKGPAPPWLPDLP